MDLSSLGGGMGGGGGGGSASNSTGKTTSATQTLEVGRGGSVGIASSDLIWIVGIVAAVLVVGGVLAYALFKK